MKFYNISDDYIQYLRDHDSTVAINKNESRPYVGALFEIGDIKYFAPLSSPKEKHKKMKNSKDFRKIDNGKLGAINLNNMIPVIEEALIPLNFDEIDDVKYRELLRRQYKAVALDEKNILAAATKLHQIVCSDEVSLTAYDRKIKARCCKLSQLEKLTKSFNTNSKEVEPST